MSGPAPAPTNRRTAGLLAVEPSRPSDRVVRGVPSAPDRIRTCDLRFRRPTLYPARVRALHARVRGALQEPAGPHPEGSSYRADDPAFLLWILACLADSAQAVYERFVRPLAAAEREAFWDDYLTVGELFALPRAQAPGDYAAYRDYIEERLASADLHVTPHARELGRLVAFDLPLPARRRP